MRLRFIIRDLLWLTVVVALAVGWWLNRKQLIFERGNWQERAGHAEDMSAQRVRFVIEENSRNRNPEPARPASPREREKEDYRKQVEPTAPDIEQGNYPK